jgi:hypothetical protein
MDQIQHGFDRGAFPGTVSPDESGDPAFFQREGHVFHLKNLIGFTDILYFYNIHVVLQKYDFHEYCKV